MGLQIGIVGLPNVGKSTLFNALTKSKGAEMANYPFCTIEPNVGIVEVPDHRLDELATVVHPEKTIPAIIEFVDIAGLVKGASAGEGLGNKFLGNIREYLLPCACRVSASEIDRSVRLCCRINVTLFIEKRGFYNQYSRPITWPKPTGLRFTKRR